MGIKKGIAAYFIGIIIFSQPALDGLYSRMEVPVPQQRLCWMQGYAGASETGSSVFTRLWKPLVVTVAAGGVTYLLYSVRSR